MVKMNIEFYKTILVEDHRADGNRRHLFPWMFSANARDIRRSQATMSYV